MSFSHLHRRTTTTQGAGRCLRALRLLCGAVLAFASASLAGAERAHASPTGIWLDHTKRGAIEIYECADGLCGRVVWMQKPLKSSGKPFRDRRNPDARLRTRTICGMQLIGKLRKSGAKTWDSGWIYDPERGQEFSLQMSQPSPDRLTVTGYVLAPAFGKSFAWTRAPEDIGRCAPVVTGATASN